MRPGPAAPSLKGRALQLLAQREHSRVELRRKLLRHVASGDAAADPEDAGAQVDALLDWLEANRYLNEARFVESRVHHRASRYGNLRIRQELAEHRVALPDDAARALQAGEIARAQAVWQRKFGEAPADAAARARQMRFLAGRGFSPDAIRGTVPAIVPRTAASDSDCDCDGDDPPSDAPSAVD